MDTRHINLLHIIPGTFKKVAATNGGEYHGSCPFCGGSDRFCIQPHADVPRWYCRQCQKHGDAIAFVEQYESLSFKQACERLSLTDYKAQPRLAPRGNQQPAHTPRRADSAWIDKAAIFTTWAHEQLLKTPAKLDYLAGRGIDADAVQRWMLGYCPQPYQRVWGDTKVFLPAGIVIPWLGSDGKPRRLRFRLDNPQQQKYTQAAGGENYLYNAHSIHSKAAVLLVEGEIDAMSAMIGFAHRNFIAVATGGTTGARRVSWLALLASANRVLVAFDDDDAGNSAAHYWLDNLVNAKRLVPLAHDVNDMLTKNISITNWILNEFR